MKIQLRLLFLFALPFLGCDLEKIEPGGQSGTFPKRFGGAAKSDKAFGIIRTSDGNFVLVGETESFGNGKTDVILLKIDEDGETVWSNQKTFGTADEDAGYAVREKLDGNLMIAGVTNRIPSTEQGGFFIETMSDGSTKSATAYDISVSGAPLYTELRDVVEGNDNKPVFAGAIALCSPGCSHLWVAKANLDGTNPQPLDGYGSGVNTYGRACTKSGGMYFACGEQFTNNTTQNDPYFARRGSDDFTDNMILTKNFPEAGNQFVNDLIPGSSGKIIAAGWSDNNSSGGSDVLFMELSTTDLTASIKKLVGDGNAEKANAIIAVNGGYVITGETTDASSGNTDVLLMKVDVNGNLIWSKKFGGAFKDIGYGVAQTSTGGFMVAGFTQFGATEAETDIYVIRTDKDGNLK